MDDPTKTYRVLRLVAENYKRLKAVDVTPNRNIQVIAGDNKQGKTSLLDAIAAALGGKKQMAAQPLRKGTEAGAIICVLGDTKPELLVKRVFDDTGKTALEITTGEGFKAPSPQAILDTLCAKIAFDPLAFTRMDEDQQVKVLRSLVDLDFTDLERERKALYDERTGVNKQAKALDAQANGIVVPDDTPDEEVSVESLMAEIKNRQEHNRRNQVERDRLDVKVRDLQRHGDIVLRLTNTIADLEKRLEAARKEHEAANEAMNQAAILRDAQEKTVAALEDQEVDSVQQQIVASQGVNRAVQAKKRKADLAKQAKEEYAAAEDLSAQIDAIDQKKAEMLAAVQWPVEGLGFGEDGVTYNGLPFSQASGAEQLRVSVAMGAASNPRLKVMLCRDASLLGKGEMETLAKIAEERDLQCWLEVVATEAGPAAVLIEDGQVVQAPDNPKAEMPQAPSRRRPPKAPVEEPSESAPWET